MAEPTVRAVIDRFEGDYAVVVFDDGQQLDWPRAALPAAVQPGVAVVVQLVATAAAGTVPGVDAETGGQAAEGWQGEVMAHSPAGEVLVQLAGGQQLRWPGTPELTAQPVAPVTLQLTPDVEDTQSRRRRVTRLLDDIFGNPA